VTSHVTSDMVKVEVKELLPVFGSFCAFPVSLRIASATFPPILAGRATDVLWAPCSWSAYCSNCRLNPMLGCTIPRFALTATSASSGVIFAVATRYAHTTVALRLMPMRQWTITRESGLSASASRINDVVAGRCARMSSYALSERGICNVRSKCVSGNTGASSRTEITWVIPRVESWVSLRAVKRSVR